MKTNYHYILYTLLFVICSTSSFLIGCKPETGGGEPVVCKYYFELKDRITDTDYWASHLTYEFGKMTSTSIDDSVHNYLSKYTSDLPNRNILGATLTGTYTLYLNYHNTATNSDIDTLRIDSYPNNASFDRAEWVKFYFNGVLVKHLNFVNDPSLRSYLAHNNQQDKPRAESIIIALPK